MDITILYQSSGDYLQETLRRADLLTLPYRKNGGRVTGPSSEIIATPFLLYSSLETDFVILSGTSKKLQCPNAPGFRRRHGRKFNQSKDFIFAAFRRLSIILG